MKGYEYSCNGILVCEDRKGKMVYVGGKQGELRDVWVKSKLNAGEIYIFVKKILKNKILIFFFRSRQTGDTQKKI